VAKKKTVDQSETENGVNVETITVYDDNWTDYVLSLLRPDELVEGKYPKYSGLVRIAGQLGFDIQSCNIEIVQTPEPANNNRATAIAKMSYALQPNALASDGTKYGLVTGPVYAQSDAADCSAINTRKPFSYHPVATASTMAQSRVLRKILRLNTHTAEEMNSPEGEESKLAQEIDERSRGITMGQKNAMIAISKRLNIDVIKFVAEIMKLSLNPSDGIEILDRLTETEAQLLLRQLQGYQKSPSDKEYLPIPSTIIIGA